MSALFKIEQKILDWVDKYLAVFVVAIITMAGMAVRLPLQEYTSMDAYGFLLPWYNHILANGISQQVGDYNFLYQLAIWLMTKLPVEPLIAYKTLSIFFDYLMAVGTGLLVLGLTKEHRVWKAVLGYGAALLLPTVVLNSAAWAQCDSIYTAFAIWALLAFVKEKYPVAMVLLGLSFAFKLQAIFILPVFLFVYYQRRKFTVLQFALIPGTMLVAGLPLVFVGRNLLDMFTIYSSQTNTYPYMSMNYPSAWLLLTHERYQSEFEYLETFAIVLTVAALALMMLVWLKKKVQAEGENVLIMAFLLAYTCVLFLPSMHERYAYPVEILAIVLAILIPKTIPLCAALQGISLCTYGFYLFNNQAFELPKLAILNILVYGGYVWYLHRRLLKEKK